MEGRPEPPRPVRPDLPEAVAATAPPLSFRWLGGREVRRDGVSVRLESAKTEALLAWLVLNPGRHPRAKLNALLWPDLPEGRAAAGLRRALWDLKRKLAPAGGRFLLVVSRTDVGVDPTHPIELDVSLLLEGGRPSGPEEPSRLEEAVALYRGDLLEGLAVEDSAAFEEWLLGERESLRLFALSALRRLVGLLRRGGEGPRALAHARRLLALDPWLEEAHLHVAELLALSGRRGAAIRQVEACRRVLQDELGAAPSKETVALERQLRSEAATPADSEAAPARGLPRNDLPVFSSPFVGRSRELEAVARQLADPVGRLLVLLGPGGAGKTRLAVQAASRVAGTGAAGLADGAVFLPPPSGTGDADLAADLARVLELEGGDRGDPAGSLMAALRDARLLLVLDAFEKRREEAPLLSRLLDGCPEIRVLVTTRERLGLEGESVLEVGGLEVPARSDSAEAARGDAVKLFLSAARRARLGFEPGAADLSAIAAICRAVGGLPLAIEVAAGWVHALPPGEVAARLSSGTALLGPDDAEGSAQRLRRVWEEAVVRLAPEERRVLSALSVFAGGMTWEGASAVGPARAETMRSLVDRSFLRLDATTGRYTLHEVLRAFAAEELRTRAGDEAAARERHTAFYVAFLARLARALHDRTEREAREELAAELENVRAALRHAAEKGEVSRLAAALAPLASAHLSWGSWAEGEETSGEAVRAGVGAPALIWRAAFRLRLGNVAAAEADLGDALAALGEGETALRAETLLHAGHAALLAGRFAEAHEALEECIPLARRSGRGRVLAEALGRLGRAVLDEGRHEEARPLFEESLAVAQALGSRAAVVYAENQLGLVDYFAGDLDEAERRLGEAVALARAEGSRPAVASALRSLAFVAEDRGDLGSAAKLYRESLAACRETGDRHGAARALMLLGEVERKRGADRSARELCEEALALARSVGSVYLAGLLEGNLAYLAAARGREREALARARAAFRAWRETGSFNVGLPVLVALAEVAVGRGDARSALALLGHVLGHPGNRQDHRIEVERVLARLRRELPGADVEGGLAAGRGRGFEELAAEALGPGVAR